MRTTVESKKISSILLKAVLILQCILFIWAGYHKEGFFVDELWSYGLANSYYAGHIYATDPFVSNEYLHKDFFADYLEVGEKDDFRYGSVYNNLSHDAHPPLYFGILHTVSSIFKNSFSKWFGIIPNIIFYLIAAYFLYLIAVRLTGNNYVGLLPVLLWGTSTQTISYVILIRMYMMLCMFGILNTWMHADCLLEGKHWSNKKLILLFSVNYFGCMTQFYYYFFAFFLSACSVFVLISRKEWKEIIRYSAVMFGAVFAAIVTFPRVINIVFESGSWGNRAAKEIVSISGYLKTLVSFWNNWKEKAFYGAGAVYPYLFASALIVCIGLWVYSCCYVRVKKTVVSGFPVVRSLNAYAISITISAFLFFVLSAKMSPFIADRYYYMITPYFWLIGVWAIYQLLWRWKKMSILLSVIMLAITLHTLLDGIRNKKIMYQYPRQAKAASILDDYAGSSCLFIVGAGREYTAVCYALQMEQFSEVLMMDISRMPIEEYDIHEDSENVIVYVDSMIDEKKVINDLLDNTRYKEYDFLTRDTGIYWEDTDEHFVYVLR